MSYRVQLFKFFSAMGDHIFRIKKSERVTNVWKTSIMLIITTALIYGWMAYLGIGSTILSSGAMQLSEAAYESSKFWFMVGRVLYGGLFASVILFVPSLLFYLLTEIPYQKLVIMQQVVLAVMLLERLIWIPLVVFVGLDWYTSPLSLGIIASYLIEIDWFVYFFGAISLFQIWIIWFKFRFLRALSGVRNSTLWLFIILLQLLGWALAATVSVADLYIISGWFE